jgi:hypothetical protein
VSKRKSKSKRKKARKNENRRNVNKSTQRRKSKCRSYRLATEIDIEQYRPGLSDISRLLTNIDTFNNAQVYERKRMALNSVNLELGRLLSEEQLKKEQIDNYTLLQNKIPQIHTEINAEEKLLQKVSDKMPKKKPKVNITTEYQDNYLANIAIDNFIPKSRSFWVTICTHLRILELNKSNTLDADITVELEKINSYDFVLFILEKTNLYRDQNVLNYIKDNKENLLNDNFYLNLVKRFKKVFNDNKECILLTYILNYLEKFIETELMFSDFKVTLKQCEELNKNNIITLLKDQLKVCENNKENEI